MRGELSDVIARQSGGVLKDWRKANACLQEEQEGGPGELQSSQHQFDPGEGQGSSNPGNHLKEKKIISMGSPSGSHI